MATVVKVLFLEGKRLERLELGIFAAKANSKDQQALISIARDRLS
ncbi:hypothetical protein PALB_13800 [Pseudoalteromonas luteoviolacea B = ATCC 29581]|nr:hypothetical protein PALB_13800 [Pseudoalteromonas luteoviolacea B = ATCC 29581]